MDLMTVWQAIIIVPSAMFLIIVVACILIDLSRRLKWLIAGEKWDGGTFSDLLQSMDQDMPWWRRG